jgi:hypothetical protein
MNESEIQSILTQAQLARTSPIDFDKQQLKELKRQLHKLAESQSLPAKDFFLSCLSDPDSEWRLNGLGNLGFHYQISPESEICDRVRALLLNDSDDYVRTTAASVLGVCSRWLDSALIKALTSDPDEFVRIVAFESLIQLAGVPMGIAFRASEAAKNGEIEPTLAEVKRIISESGIDIDKIPASSDSSQHDRPSP